MADAIRIQVDANNRAWIDGEEIHIPAEEREDVPTYITGLAAKTLQPGESRPLEVTSPTGVIGNLVLHADGHTELSEGAPAPAAPVDVPPRARESVVTPMPTRAAQRPVEPVVDPEPEAEPLPEAAPMDRRAARPSFLTEERREQPATRGLRGALARVGVRVAPSEAELAERADVHAVSQHWPGPRTIAIVNGKGGANKTPTTALLSAVFARYGGSGVLAWDNNQTRGTLGWRTEQGPHDGTVQTILPYTDRLLSPAAQSSDLAHFVHHQTADKYDVLRSNPNVLAKDQTITAADFDALHGALAKYFRLIFIDSGNDESAEQWLRMVDHTDQLVIATTALDESAEAGALLLEALHDRDARSSALADNAVVVVSQSEKSPSPGAKPPGTVAKNFRSIARAAVTIPFDENFHSGQLRYDALAPQTQRKWLAAAAAVAAGL